MKIVTVPHTKFVGDFFRCRHAFRRTSATFLSYARANLIRLKDLGYFYALQI